MTDSKLDRIDLRILSHLQKRGRMSNVELADAVGLSPSPCLIRVKRLEKAGYIGGYGAHIQLEKLGDVQVVFTEVTLADHRREDFDRFVAAIRNVDEIVECHLASGGYDYLLKFITRSVSHYQTIVEGLLEQNIGIAKYFSYVIIKSPFVKRQYPPGIAVRRPAVIRLGRACRLHLVVAINGRRVRTRHPLFRCPAQHPPHGVLNWPLRNLELRRRPVGRRIDSGFAHRRRRRTMPVRVHEGSRRCAS